MVPTPRMPGAGSAEAAYRGQAMQQLRILKQQMQISGLKQAERRVNLGDGVELVCSISFNDERAYVKVPAKGGAAEEILYVPVLNYVLKDYLTYVNRLSSSGTVNYQTGRWIQSNITGPSFRIPLDRTVPGAAGQLLYPEPSAGHTRGRSTESAVRYDYWLGVGGHLVERVVNHVRGGGRYCFIPSRVADWGSYHIAVANSKTLKFKDIATAVYGPVYAFAFTRVGVSERYVPIMFTSVRSATSRSFESELLRMWWSPDNGATFEPLTIVKSWHDTMLLSVPVISPDGATMYCTGGIATDSSMSIDLLDRVIKIDVSATENIDKSITVTATASEWIAALPTETSFGTFLPGDPVDYPPPPTQLNENVAYTTFSRAVIGFDFSGEYLITIYTAEYQDNSTTLLYNEVSSTFYDAVTGTSNTYYYATSPAWTGEKVVPRVRESQTPPEVTGNIYEYNGAGRVHERLTCALIDFRLGRHCAGVCRLTLRTVTDSLYQVHDPDPEMVEVGDWAAIITERNHWWIREIFPDSVEEEKTTGAIILASASDTAFSRSVGLLPIGPAPHDTSSLPPEVDLIPPPPTLIDWGTPHTITGDSISYYETVWAGEVPPYSAVIPYPDGTCGLLMSWPYTLDESGNAVVLNIDEGLVAFHADGFSAGDHVIFESLGNVTKQLGT